jgi:thiamine biosynthesis lipoprotein
MGTYYRITARCPAMSSDAIRAGVVDELNRVNKQMSTYDDNSELMQFNQSAELVWLDVSKELVSVVEAAQQISLRSGGAFDITVGPLINIWGFGPGGAVAAAPSAEAVQVARARVGFQYLKSRSSAPALRKSKALFVDLSAIAKGHGVDRVTEVLDQAACTDYLVDIGGEVRSRGLSPRQASWRVGIEVPDPQLMGSIQRVVSLPGVAVATSGDYRNYLDFDGERFSHSIDPRTGYPVQHLLASVSVVHESAMWADGWATALNVLGPEAGLDLAVSENLAAYFLIRRADGFEERYTPAMQNYLEAP